MWSTCSSNRFAVDRPVERGNKRIIFLIFIAKFVFWAIFTNFVNIYVAIVGANSQKMLAWWVAHDFIPFIWFFHRSHFSFEVFKFSYWNFAPIIWYSNVPMFFRITNCSSLLIWLEFPLTYHSTHFLKFHFGLFIWKFSLLFNHFRWCVNKHKLVIISTS
jgi:hypothetical protein